MRTSSLAATVLIFLLGSADAQARRRAQAAPYIRETLVIAPRQVGDFLLRDMTYDPAQKWAGVGVRYAHVHHPDVRIDVFVYPVGKQDEAAAVSAGMRELRESFGVAEQKGYYRDVRIGDVATFEVRRDSPHSIDGTASPVAVAAAGAAAGAQSSDDGPVALVQASPALTQQGLVKGERITLDVTRDGAHVRSRGYIFYKQLYYFKGRISASDQELRAPDFERLTDDAMRALVPAVRAVNIGSCGDTTIEVSTDQDAATGADALMQAMAAAMASHEADGCVAELSADERMSHMRGNQVVSITFDADDWSTK